MLDKETSLSLVESKYLSSKEKLVTWRNKTKGKLVIAIGVFDLLHSGHMQYLARAKEEGDFLLVAINSDASVKRLKGEGRPIVNQLERCFMLSCLAFVDKVIVFDEDNASAILDVAKPEFYAKGGDYNIESLNKKEREILEKHKIEIKLLNFKKGFSTSSIIDKIKEKN